MYTKFWREQLAVKTVSQVKVLLLIFRFPPKILKPAYFLKNLRKQGTFQQIKNLAKIDSQFGK